MSPFTFIKHALGGNVKMDEFKREFRAGDVYGALDALVRTQEKIMSALTDLQSAVAAAVSEIAALQAQVSATPQPSSVSDADAEALATQLTNAVNPPPAALVGEPQQGLNPGVTAPA